MARATASGSSSATGPRARAEALYTTMSGTPCVAITASNRPPTSSGSAASQAKVAAAVSRARTASRSGLRDASATCSPFFANNRASEALRPLPTPTIRADRISMANLRAWFVPLGLPIITGNTGEGTLPAHWRHVMLGLMQQQPLLVSWLLSHAARHHGGAEVVSATASGALHHTTWAETERRARQLVRVLQRPGGRAQDRGGPLAWNDYRHLEVYYATSGMQAICHTINPRLAPDDIAYIINHAGDSALFVDPGFAPLIGVIAARISDCVHTVVMMTDAASMPALDLAGGTRLLCYDELMADADDDYAWPEFDENTASALCYTSGTTG